MSAKEETSSAGEVLSGIAALGALRGGGSSSSALPSEGARGVSWAPRFLLALRLPPLMSVRHLVLLLVLALLAVETHAQGRSTRLVHGWIADSASVAAGRLTDAAGSRHATLAGGPSFRSFGTIPAVVFDGKDDDALVTDQVQELRWPALELTIEAWVRPDGVAGKQAEAGIISFSQDNGAFERGAWLGWHNSSFAFGLAPSSKAAPDGKMHVLKAREPITFGRWYHVVGTWNGTTQRLYVDAMLVAEKEHPRGRVAWPDKGFVSIGSYRDDNERDHARMALHSVEVFQGAMPGARVRRRHGEREAEFPAQKLPEVLPISAAELDPAIEKGVRWLLARQQLDGSWLGGGGRWKHYYGMTPLATYTLLKCGIPADHPAIRIAVSWMNAQVDAGHIHRTYDLGCFLQAYGALPEKARPVARMKKLIEETLDIRGNRSERGLPRWGYPGNHGGAGLEWFDLSNSQYALLGLKAALSAGLEVGTPTWWERIAQDLMEQQTAYGGFSYKGTGDALSASMTVAGLGAMIICQDALGDAASAATSNGLRSGITNGIRWLGDNWSVTGNRHLGDATGFSNGWHLYYLYGLERVGSFLKRDRLAKRDWHSEGARHLLEIQKAGGDWGYDYDTCFALLFLRRGSRASGLEPRSHAKLETKDSPVTIGGQATQPALVYLRGIDDKLRARLEARGAPRVKLHWEVDGARVKTHENLDARGLLDAGRSLRHAFEKNGAHEIVAIVELPGEGGTELVKSKPVVLQIDGVEESWHREALADVQTKLEPKVAPSVRVSSHLNGDHTGERVIDGWHATSWLKADNSDPQPRIELSWRKPQRAKVLKLASARPYGGNPKAWLRPRDIKLQVNGTRARTIRLEDMPLRKHSISLGRGSVRSISIQVLSWHRSGGERAYGGFQEIELHDEKVVLAEKDLARKPAELRWILPLASRDKTTWMYTFADPGDRWMLPELRPRGWKKGKGGWGTEGRVSPNPVRTTWKSESVWVRGEFRLRPKDLENQLRVEINHDDAAEIWINGFFVADAEGFSEDGYRTFVVPEDVHEQLKKGKNLIAVRCNNTGGASYLDVGISTLER